jgi:SAM-dependent methyltransferase
MKISAVLRSAISKVRKGENNAANSRRRNDRFNDHSRWTHHSDVSQRNYQSYEQYVEHQSSKLDNIVDQLERRHARDFQDFRCRFETCAPLREARNVLCLGARLGPEVQALLDLGYFAVGIDLNPGPKNAYVLHGDFHKLVFANDSVDAVYTNVLDHVFDLEKLLSEVKRVLRPEGLFIADLVYGTDEGTIAGDYEAFWWHDSKAMIDQLAVMGNFNLVESRELPQFRKGRWRQGVMRKPLNLATSVVQEAISSSC